MSELEIKVFGRVQGVRFRHTVQSEAKKHDLKGMVFNRPDGSVEIIAQGSKRELAQFLSWLQQSPGFSNVKGINYLYREHSQQFQDFSIIKDAPFIPDQIKSFLNLGKSIFNRKQKTVPVHVAIIPDGNRRWAKTKGLAPQAGHYTSASFHHMQELFTEARRLGVKYLTLWGFSTENWKRNSVEVNAIFDLILKNINQFREDAHTNKIRFRHLGRKDRLPKELMHALVQVEEETAKYTEFNVQLCLDYGGRDELMRAVNKMLHERVSVVNEDTFSRYLDSADIPDIDLIIRTSGEQRLSGFMPFQSVYAELYFTPLHFPDFDAKHLRKAVLEFASRQRRFGGDVKK